MKGLSQEQAIEGAKLYEAKIVEGKTLDYANRYVNAKIVCGKNDEEADKEATIFENEQRFNDCRESILKTFKIAKKSEQTYKRKHDLVDRKFNCVADYDKLAADLQKEADEMRAMSKIFDEEIHSGKSKNYAKEYARLIIVCKEEERVAREMAEIFDRCINEGINPELSRKRAETVVKGTEIEPSQKRARY